MKKTLILTNTLFQIIVALQLKLTKYQNDEVTLIISDHSFNYKSIVNNLKKLNIFKDVYIAKTREYIHGNNMKDKLKRNLFSNIFSNTELNKLINLENKYYDEFLFYNLDAFTYLLYAVLYSKNKKIIANRFEEGFCTYLYGDDIKENSKKIRKLFLKKDLYKEISKLYLFNPDLIIYDTNFKIEKIESIDKNNEKLVNAVNAIFDYKSIQDKYYQKYIFFEESFFCDNKGINDMDLILKIADIVGKENLMVKLHPRNKVDRFSKYGITTNKAIGVPWEIIQMNNDFSDKVFLTISSGSVLASRLYFNDNIKTYLLYNCTDKMSDMVTNEFFEYMEKVKNQFGINNFIIPKNKENFYELLEGEIKNGN